MSQTPMDPKKQRFITWDERIRELEETITRVAEGESAEEKVAALLLTSGFLLRMAKDLRDLRREIATMRTQLGLGPLD